MSEGASQTRSVPSMEALTMPPGFGLGFGTRTEARVRVRPPFFPSLHGAKAVT